MNEECTTTDTRSATWTNWSEGDLSQPESPSPRRDAAAPTAPNDANHVEQQ